MLRAAWIVFLLAAQSPPEAIIEQVRQNVLNYDKQLPDFLCEEVIQRFYDPQEGSNWRFLDTVTAQVTYFEGKEQYTHLRLYEGHRLGNPLGNALGNNEKPG